MLDEKSPLALYHQLKNIIMDNIKNKVWEINTKLPTERELCEMYNVSRITVRQALKELENEGYIYRKQGKGTFVTRPKFVQKLSRLYSFSNEIKNMGAVPSTKIISFDLAGAELHIADKLNIDVDEKVYAVKRLRLADNEPFAFEISYLVYKYAPNLTRESIDKYGLYNALRLDCGIDTTEAEETFEAVAVNAEAAKYLQVRKKDPALHLERITYADGKIIEYCTSIIRGDKYKYRIRLGKQST